MAMATRAPSCRIKIVFHATDISRHTEATSQMLNAVATHAAGAANHALRIRGVAVAIRGYAHQRAIGSVSLRQTLTRC